MPCSTASASDNFSIFEDALEIRRTITGRAVTGLDLR
jgi:hypothetical protein